MTNPPPDWHVLAATVEYPTDLLIDGGWVPGEHRSDVVSPIDGRVITDVAYADAASVDRAVASARRAFEDRRWSGMAPADRKDVLIRWSHLVNEHAEQLAVLTSLEMGKPAREAQAIDVRACHRTLRWYGEAIDKVLDEMPSVPDSSWALIEREPAGVVGAITPWNFPLTLETWKVAPALAVGCSVVLKPAELSPLTALYVARLGLEAGLPDGVLNVVNGSGAVAGAALAGHMDVDVITFTGSTATGRAIMAAAAQSNMKRPYLELGGKGANIVFPDADLDKAAAATAWAVTYNAGQMCTAGSRLIVHESIKDEVVGKVLEAMAALQPNDPLRHDAPLGAIASARQLETIHSIVTEGLAEGGHLLMGGEPVLTESGGSYYPPTVVEGLNPHSLLAQKEVFGPVLSVLTFATDDEAIAIGNATPYGLASAIWTNDLNRARRASKGLRMGTVWVNCFEEGDLTVPFGGVKQSGFGSDKSLHALEKFTNLKTTWIELS
ncbi:MAG: aldehyde dehydrogenase family protein [Candidatus Nanopelagicales bacterium]|nr:aldehyde dehydrogenase family protein [Candidatus Nanopelagicales bacterium]